VEHSASGADWLHEIKFDRWRLLARNERPRFSLDTPDGIDRVTRGRRAKPSRSGFRRGGCLLGVRDFGRLRYQLPSTATANYMERIGIDTDDLLVANPAYPTFAPDVLSGSPLSNPTFGRVQNAVFRCVVGCARCICVTPLSVVAARRLREAWSARSRPSASCAHRPLDSSV